MNKLRTAFRAIAVSTALFSLSVFALPIWGGSCAKQKYEVWGGYVYDCGLTGETFTSCTYGCSCIDCTG